MFVKFDRKPGQIVINPNNVVYAFEQIDPATKQVTGVGVVFKGNPNTLTLQGISMEEFQNKINCS